MKSLNLTKSLALMMGSTILLAACNPIEYGMKTGFKDGVRGSETLLAMKKEHPEAVATYIRLTDQSIDQAFDDDPLEMDYYLNFTLKLNTALSDEGVLKNKAWEDQAFYDLAEISPSTCMWGHLFPSDIPADEDVQEILGEAFGPSILGPFHIRKQLDQTAASRREAHFTEEDFTDYLAEIFVNLAGTHEQFALDDPLGLDFILSAQEGQVTDVQLQDYCDFQRAFRHQVDNVAATTTYLARLYPTVKDNSFEDAHWQQADDFVRASIWERYVALQSEAFVIE